MYNGWQCSHLIVFLLRQSKQLSKLANAYAWFADEQLLVNSNSPSFYCHRTTSMKSAAASCSWLMMNSMSGHTVHFTLSWNYPEIHGCRQHLPAQLKVFVRVHSAETSQFESNSSFNVQRSLSAGLRPHS